jgi:hypothetical protein
MKYFGGTTERIGIQIWIRAWHVSHVRTSYTKYCNLSSSLELYIASGGRGIKGGASAGEDSSSGDGES